MSERRVRELMAQWRTLRFGLSEEDAAEAWAESMAIHEDTCPALHPPVEAVPTVEALAEALHDAMCDVSHHDRPPARCSRWPTYPNIAQSVVDRLERMARP